MWCWRDSLQGLPPWFCLCKNDEAGGAVKYKQQALSLWLGLAVALFLASVAAAWVLLRDEAAVQRTEWDAFALLMGGFGVLFVFATVTIVKATILAPAKRLAVDLGAIAHGEARQSIDMDRYTQFPALAVAANALALKLSAARAQVGEAVAAATVESHTEKARLAAILNDLHEGVVVCNWKHQVVLYNQIALGLLHVAGEMGLGRPLFGLVAKEPVLHILDVLTHRTEKGPGSAPFVTGTTDGRSLLQGRMSLVRTQNEVTGYVITFNDVTESVSALARRDAILREIIEDLRGPVQRLNDPACDPAMAALDISTALERASNDYRSLLTGWWPMTDIHSADLFDFVIRHLGDSGLKINLTGLPIWLHGDSHTLVLAIEALVKNIAQETGAKDFDVGAEADGRHGWIFVTWTSELMEDDSLAAWQKARISQALGGMTVRDVICHHTREEIVKERIGQQVTLRIALPLGREGQDRFESVEKLPPRPEFFDFNLLAQAQAGDLGQASLRSLTYVVFDTETTGLKPMQGDQVVSLAGVRVVNGRILTGETFNRIINPGRQIPAESVKFHGITDEMVVNKPPLMVVLPQFKAYAADAVLVAHNAAFDLKFIRMRETECGVVFDNRVLDTMLLSSFIDGTAENQSLDAIAERYGITVTDRHTALGDSLVTAAILLRLIDALEDKGISTLDQAMTTLNMTMELHNRGLAFN
jgi:DNA polymerase-3 subunit epsilon